MDKIIKILISAAIYIAIAAIISWYYYSYKKKDLLGGFIGGLLVAFVSAVLGGELLNTIVRWIMRQMLDNGFVNIVAALIGGLITMYIFNKINHDRNRSGF